jgi:hypothetical protein
LLNENNSVPHLSCSIPFVIHPLLFDNDDAIMSFVTALWRAGAAARGLSTPTHIAPFVVSATSGVGGVFGAPTAPLMQAAAAAAAAEGVGASGTKPSGSPITKADLVKTVAAAHSMSQAQSKRIVDTVFGTISEVQQRRKLWHIIRSRATGVCFSLYFRLAFDCSPFQQQTNTKTKSDLGREEEDQDRGARIVLDVREPPAGGAQPARPNEDRRPRQDPDPIQGHQRPEGDGADKELMAQPTLPEPVVVDHLHTISFTIQF